MDQYIEVLRLWENFNIHILRVYSNQLQLTMKKNKSISVLMISDQTKAVKSYRSTIWKPETQSCRYSPYRLQNGFCSTLGLSFSNLDVGFLQNFQRCIWVYNGWQFCPICQQTSKLNFFLSQLWKPDVQFEEKKSDLFVIFFTIIWSIVEKNHCLEAWVEDSFTGFSLQSLYSWLTARAAVSKVWSEYYDGQEKMRYYNISSRKGGSLQVWI